MPIDEGLSLKSMDEAKAEFKVTRNKIMVRTGCFFLASLFFGSTFCAGIDWVFNLSELWKYVLGGLLLFCLWQPFRWRRKALEEHADTLFEQVHGVDAHGKINDREYCNAINEIRGERIY